jgi:hypothetical protein
MDKSEKTKAIQAIINFQCSRRAKRAAATLKNYSEGSTEEQIIDFATDVMHLCDTLKIPIDECIGTAKEHYEEEKNFVC